jgi:predicted O-methyltransferase YrrM
MKVSIIQELAASRQHSSYMCQVTAREDPHVMQLCRLAVRARRLYMSKRRVVLYVIALATTATLVLALLDRSQLAIAALAIAMVSMFGWVVLWARALNARVGQIGAEIERQGRRNLRVADLGTTIGSLDERLSSTQQYVARRADAHDDKLAGLSRGLYGLRVQVDRTPSASAELDRVYRRLVHHVHPMPELGGWAMTSPTLVWVVDQISSGRVSTILECGSGSSTVWFALALEQRGAPGRIVSLESSPAYADKTRAKLAELGLTHRAQVLTASLIDLELPGRDLQPWYDLSVLADEITGVDLLFVDGPVGDTSPQARYPALPALADRLTDDALVLLDDSNRGSEKQGHRAVVGRNPRRPPVQGHPRTRPSNGALRRSGRRHALG